jgi:DNA-binding NtrC family response regulator
LRERPEDIAPLIDYYLEEYTRQFNTDKIIRPSQNVIDQLTRYHWPGNVRELQNILKRMLVLGNAEKILNELQMRAYDSSDTAVSTPDNKPPVNHMGIIDLYGKDSPSEPSFSLKKIRKTALDRIEKEVISHVLDQTGWNRSKATKILKISYKTLLYKISDLGITPPPKEG